MEYTFRCKDCGLSFVVYAKLGCLNMIDMKCPGCNGQNYIRKWDAPTVHYKGEGFTKGTEKEE
jgi:phage FluMu protein Com